MRTPQHFSLIRSQPREQLRRGDFQHFQRVDRWRVVPNALLETPRPAAAGDRRHLRVNGPFRMIARLGAEKGIGELIADARSLRNGREGTLTGTTDC